MDRFATLRNGLVAAWCPSLGDTGLLLRDRSPWRRNTTLPSSLVTAYAGRMCLRPTGASSIQTPFNVLGLGDFTVSAWAWADSFSATSRIVDSSYSINFWIGQGLSSGQFGGGIQQSGSPYGTYATGRLNAWLCIVMTKQGSAQTVRVFDGTSVSTATGTTPAGFQSQALYIASSFDGASKWSGGIDDIRIYSRALTGAECALLATRPGIGLIPTTAVALKFPTTLYQNVGGVWKPTQPQINVGGTWKAASPAINVGGVWK